MTAPVQRTIDSAFQDRPCQCKQGPCLNCCNGVTGVVVDLSTGGPEVGTFDTPDGGTIEVVRFELAPGSNALIFAPTGFPDGWNASQRVPTSVCCYRPIGIVEWIKRDSGESETGHYFGCIYGGFFSNGVDVTSALVVEFVSQDGFRRDYWFWRDLSATYSRTAPGPGSPGTQTTYPMQSVLCRADSPIELTNDTSVAMDTGYTLNVRATRCTDTHLPVDYSVVCTPEGQETQTPTITTDDVANCNPAFSQTFTKTCGNPCEASREITVTFSTSGKIAFQYDYDPTPEMPGSGDEEEDLTLVFPDMAVTFSIQAGCGEVAGQIIESVAYDISGTGYPDAVAILIVAVRVNEKGEIIINAVDAGDGVAVVALEGDIEESFVSMAFEEDFKVGTIKCGEIELNSGTVDCYFEYQAGATITYTVT